MSNIKEKTQKTKSEKVLFIIGIVLLVIMVPILILDAVLLIKGAVNDDEVPSVFGVKPLVIMSDSMELNDDPELAQDIARGESYLDNPDFIWDNSDPIYYHDLIFVKDSDIEDYLLKYELTTTNTAEQNQQILKTVNDEIVGRTIAFKYPEPDGSWSVVVHRIAMVEWVGKEGESLTPTKSGWSLRTYGIHNETVDNWTVDPGVIQGEWHGSRIGGIGAFVDFLSHWYGIVIFVGVPVVAVVAYDIITSKLHAQKQANAKNAELEAELAKLKAEKEALEEARKEQEQTEE